MKKCIALLLGLLLLLPILTGVSLAEEDALPNVGDTVEGFTVKSVSRFELIGADVVLFEHDKTGAKVMYLANDDTNRVFEITFKTPAETESGIPHVFEHSTLDGSKKYPSKELFFNLSYQTYNTYMNAATYPFMTTYPVASLSEAQLLKYADYYTDSCFNPMLYEDSSIFDEECWRYALSSADSDLTIEGTVYSEMRGAYTIDSAALFNCYKTLFPGSTIGNCSGGNPAYIPDMTYEDLLTYHQKYYHPSNSMTCLYGSFEDYTAFLKLLDGYFSQYEKKDIVIEDSNYTPITESNVVHYTYGVEASSNTENGAVIYYGMVLDNPTQEELDQLDLLSTLLSDGSSVLVQSMKEALPSATISCGLDTTGPEPAFIFSASGVNADDAEVFCNTINKSLSNIVENGFDSETLDAIIAALRIKTMLSGESSKVGVDTIPNIVYYWAASDNEFGYMHYVDTLDLFDDYAADGTFCRVTEKFLIGNQRTALAVTEPVAGLKEQEDAALAEKLAAVKASMSEEEIAALVAKTNGTAQSSEETVDTAAMVKELQAVTVESLPEEARIYDITDTTEENGIRYIEAEADVNGIGQTLLMLDASGMEQDELHYFKLFVDLVGGGRLDTEEHTRAQLSSLMTRYLYDSNIRVSELEDDTERGYTPYMRVSFIVMDEDMTAAYDLLHELIFEAKLDDVERLADSISAIKTSLKKTMTNYCYYMQLYRAFASCDAPYAYYDYTTYLNYYTFLCDAEKLISEDPETVIAHLKTVQAKLNNSQNAIVGFAGSEASAENHKNAANAFLSTLDKKEIVPQEYTFPTISRAEAMVIDSSVQYNMIFASFEDLGLEKATGAMDAIAALVTDNYLYPLLRDQYGAYSVMHGASDYGIYILSYRDPNVKETFDIYRQLPELVAQLQNIDQETLDGYILSCYSRYALSQGELNGALSAMLDTLCGIEQTKKLDAMKSLKSVTPETVAEYVAVYQALAEKGMISTSASASTIEANSDLYDTVLIPFANDESAVMTSAMTDVAEDAWYYTAVHFVAENGLMSPVNEEIFGAEEPLTAGELVCVLSQMVGGDAEFDSAVALLSSVGIVPANIQNDAVLNVGDLATYANKLLSMGGMTLYDGSDAEGLISALVANGLLYATEDAPLNAEDTAPRAQLAYLLATMYTTQQ